MSKWLCRGAGKSMDDKWVIWPRGKLWKGKWTPSCLVIVPAPAYLPVPTKEPTLLQSKKWRGKVWDMEGNRERQLTYLWHLPGRQQYHGGNSCCMQSQQWYPIAESLDSLRWSPRMPESGEQPRPSRVSFERICSQQAPRKCWDFLLWAYGLEKQVRIDSESLSGETLREGSINNLTWPIGMFQ